MNTQTLHKSEKPSIATFSRARGETQNGRRDTIEDSREEWILDEAIRVTTFVSLEYTDPGFRQGMNILRASAFFGREAIPIAFAAEIAGEDQPDGAEVANEEHPGTRAHGPDGVLRCLIDFDLVRLDVALGAFSVSDVGQAMVKRSLRGRAQRQSLARCLRGLDACYRSASDEMRRGLLPHVLSALAASNPWHAEIEAGRRLFKEAGLALIAAGWPDEARALTRDHVHAILALNC